MDFTLLHEDKDLIVVVKPPNMPSQKDFSGDLDLLTAVERYLGKPLYSEDPYAYLIHRLDRPVGGIMVLSKNEKTASDLSGQFQERLTKKSYLAVVCNPCVTDKGVLVDYLIKKPNNMAAVVSKGSHLAKRAELSFQVLERLTIHNERLSLLSIELMTGRYHQIRVQLAHAGMPIWGDTKYNEAFMKERNRSDIGLFAHRLQFIHPKTQQVMEFHEKPRGEIFSSFSL